MKLKTLATRSLISLSVLLTISVFHLGYFENSILKEMENELYDLRLRATMENTKSQNIVIVDIDEKSLAKEGHWPWQRNKLASLVNTLFDYYEVNSLGFDMVFAEHQEPSALNLIDSLSQTEPNLDLAAYRQNYLYDEQFAESLFARNSVLGFVFKQNHNQNSNQESGILPPPIAPASILSNASKHLHQPTSYTSNIDTLQLATDYAGFFDYVRSDDTLRKVPLIQSYNQNLYPSLSLQLAAVSLGRNYQFNLSADGQVLESIQLGDIVIPLDQSASMYVPYRGYMGSFEYLSATDVIHQKLAVSQLKGKIVILGTSAAGLLDLRATPVGDSYVGVEAHANTLSGILEQRIKTKPNFVLALELLQLLVVTLLMTLIFPRLTPRLALMFLGLMVATVCFANIFIWQKLNIVFDLAASLSLLALLAFFHINYNFFIEQKNKRRLSKVFSQYIPSQVVERFDIDEAEMSLIGDHRQMTVFFADVRGFTSISEDIPPKQLTQLMNAFLTPITHAIHQYDGTIDKYMGDAVMAFWGAPIKDLQHANHAVASSIAVLEALKELNHEFSSKQWPEIKLGIGLASGDMSVGNMGSEFRVAYTVMGDTVNLGSRLEGLTKIYGLPILVSEETKKLATEFEFFMVDKVRVKGKFKPVTVFSPYLTAEPDHQKIEQALIEYWQGNFKLAKGILKEIKAKQLTKLSNLFIKRCDEYLLTPPDSDWDGVFTHTQK